VTIKFKKANDITNMSITLFTSILEKISKLYTPTVKFYFNIAAPKPINNPNN